MGKGRQLIHEMEEINPHTGLPKHVYHYNHPHCHGQSIRGGFTMKRRKYVTKHYYWGDDTGVTLEEAIEACREELDQIKTDVGYWDFLDNEDYRKRVRRLYQHESLYPKDGSESRASMEDIRRRNGYTIRHIGSGWE